MRKERRKELLRGMVGAIKKIAEQAKKENSFSHRGFYKPRKPMEK